MKKPVKQPRPAKPEPPYDAVRLLMQMEEAARARILAAFDLKSSFIHCVVTLENGKLQRAGGQKFQQSILRADYMINDHKMSTAVSFFNEGETVPFHVRENLKKQIVEDVVSLMLSGAWDRILEIRAPK